MPFRFSILVSFTDRLISGPCLLGLWHTQRRHSAAIRHATMTMNAIANAHICLLNDFISRSFALISSPAPLSSEAIKKLEDSRDALQKIRSHHFSDLLLMTKLVAVGVILEGPELVYEIVQLVKRWREKTTRDHAPGAITVIGLVGWALVAVGVAGEFWVDSWVNTDDDNIQSINITLIRDAGSSAATASVAAKSAVGAAQSASEIAGKAKGEADTSMTRVAKVQEGIVSANASLADIQARIAWRSVSEAQKEELKERLASFHGRRVTVIWDTTDPEVNSFGQELVSALQFAGLEAHSDVMGLMIPSPGQSLVLDMTISGSTRNPFLNALTEALVCSSLARPPIAAFPSGPYDPNISLTIRPRNPAPKPPIPIGCMSSMGTSP